MGVDRLDTYLAFECNFLAKFTLRIRNTEQELSIVLIVFKKVTLEIIKTLVEICLNCAFFLVLASGLIILSRVKELFFCFVVVINLPKVRILKKQELLWTNWSK
jgi:hypothetical protein